MMMATTIGFQGKDVWLKANWVVQRLFQDVRERYRLCREDEYEFEQDIALNGMSFLLMNPDMRYRIMQMIKKTAEDLVNDTFGKYKGDFSNEQYQLYRNAMPSLLELIEKYENADWPPEEEI
jgi:hypothetical protein